jgi:hypothetical protein
MSVQTGNQCECADFRVSRSNDLKWYLALWLQKIIGLINSRDCETRILPSRRSATIFSLEQPGFLRPPTRFLTFSAILKERNCFLFGPGIMECPWKFAWGESHVPIILSHMTQSQAFKKANNWGFVTVCNPESRHLGKPAQILKSRNSWKPPGNGTLPSIGNELSVLAEPRERPKLFISVTHLSHSQQSKYRWRGMSWRWRHPPPPNWSLSCCITC